MAHKQFSIDMSQCGFVDPQLQMGSALANRDINSFRAALEMGAEPQRPDANHMSVFERALHSYGCADFVRECLQYGCNSNHVNKHFKKAAINFAVDSLDPQILSALLTQQNVQVDWVYEKLSPLNALAKSLNADNVAEVSNCIKQLLHYGASANIPDQRQFTPLLYVVKNRKIDDAKKRELIQMFLEQDDIDLDTYREGELRSILQDQYAGQWNLPPQRDTSGGAINVDTLLLQLRSADEEQFLKDFQVYVAERSQNNNLTNTGAKEMGSLLVECIKRGTHAAFVAVLDNVTSESLAQAGQNPIKTAVTWGNWYALEKLLRHDQIKVNADDQLLISVVSRLDEKPVFEYSDYQKCFEILLASEHVDVNECDRSGSTALHYAVKYRNNPAIQALLSRGAYLGKRNAFSELPMNGMPPSVLSDHLDDCVTTNGLAAGDTNFEIQMNYKNLILTQRSSTPSVGSQQLRDEMTPIGFLAESKEHRHLLQHPLITSYLFLKWHRLSVVFYLNFLFYAFFAVSIIVHTLLKFRESDHQTWTAIFAMCAWIGIVYMIVRELMQLIVSPSLYLRSPLNYLEIALIVLSVVTCKEPNYKEENPRVIAVCTILLVALELCLLVGSLPVLSISTHMLMLREVSRSFLKSFTLYSIFVITFSLCFYILLGKPELDENGLPKPNEDFNKFTNPVSAVIKTIVMLTGEFDAGDISFNNLYGYILFLLFVMFMSIVLFNLLNGLAVSDTQAIKAQAELNGSICRANLLVRYEEVLTGRSERTNFIVRHEPFRTICRRLMNIYPNYMAGRQIAILPNDGNKVMIPIANAYEMQDLIGKSVRNNTQKASFLPIVDKDMERERKPLDPPIHCLCSCISGRCSRMDVRTVEMSLAVLDQKAVKKLEKHRKFNTEMRLQNIEEKLEKMFALLQGVQTK